MESLSKLEIVSAIRDSLNQDTILSKKTMVLRFELIFYCDNKFPKLEKDTNLVPTDWADYMDPDVMTTFLGDVIFNIEEEEYWEASQHALKNSYEARIDDENDEGGRSP